MWLIATTMYNTNTEHSLKCRVLQNSVAIEADISPLSISPYNYLGSLCLFYKIMQRSKEQKWMPESKNQQTFSVKGQIESILCFVGHPAFVTISQLWHYRQGKNSHTQYVNKWVWLCSNKPLLSALTEQLSWLERCLDMPRLQVQCSEGTYKN